MKSQHAGALADYRVRALEHMVEERTSLGQPILVAADRVALLRDELDSFNAIAVQQSSDSLRTYRPLDT